jgi:flavoprotein
MQARPEKPRLAWAVTGSGHYLEECLEIIKELKGVDLFYSRRVKKLSECMGMILKA